MGDSYIFVCVYIYTRMSSREPIRLYEHDGKKYTAFGIDKLRSDILEEELERNEHETADPNQMMNTWEEAVPIHPSNVIVTKLFEGDTLRLKRLIERTGGVEE